MPRTDEVTPEEVKGVIAQIKKRLFLQAVVDLDLDLACHRAHEQAQAEATAEAYASAGRTRSAATLGECLALAGIAPGHRAAEAGWVVLVSADAAEPQAAPAAVSAALTQGNFHETVGPTTVRPARPKKSTAAGETS